MEKVKSHRFVLLRAGTNIDDVHMVNSNNTSVNEWMLKRSVEGVCVFPFRMGEQHNIAMCHFRIDYVFRPLRVVSCVVETSQFVVINAIVFD